MAESLGGERVEPKEALLFLARWMLESVGETADGEARAGRGESLYTILYHRCPDCRQAHLPTADGLVEIPPEVVDRVEGDAVRVAIDPQEELPARAANARANPEIEESVPAEERDRPNPPSLVRKVRLRDGCACANPMCRRKGRLHAHHIIYRGAGGRTALFNEVCVCDRCHACLHAGLLRVSGDPAQGLIWRTRSDGIAVDLREELAAMAGLPEVRVESGGPDPSRGPDESGTPDPSGTPDSGAVGGEEPEWLLRQPLLAMERIGYSKSEGKERLLWAWRKLAAEGKEPRDQEVLLHAIRGNRAAG